jgi:transcription elongation factor GreA
MKSPLTPYGYAVLRKELLKLKSLRPSLALAIEVARAHGDLSENADYDAAKERSGMIEAKIRDIETTLANCEVIDPITRGAIGSRVVFGVAVKIEELESGEERDLTLVGAQESDTDKGYISVLSPIGKALIGRDVGDIVKVNAPSGAKEYEVREVSPVDWVAKVTELDSVGNE